MFKYFLEGDWRENTEKQNLQINLGQSFPA